jgi:hypothetical protein
VCSNELLTRSHVLQIDIFREKLPVSPMSHYFPDYRGDDNDYDAACGFLLDKFVSLNQNLDKSIYAVSRSHLAFICGNLC